MALAIARPTLAVTLIESTGKKADCLVRLAGSLGLTNVNVLRQRAEETGRGEHRGSFDVATARAVGRMVFVGEWGLPLLRPGGVLLAMKGPAHTAELAEARKAIRMLGGGEAEVHPAGAVELGEHVIVAIRKTGATPAKYPRLPSEAKDRPLA